MVDRIRSTTRIEISPDERKRRLCRVYTILLDLAHIAEIAGRKAPSELSCMAAQDGGYTSHGVPVSSLKFEGHVEA